MGTDFYASRVHKPVDTVKQSCKHQSDDHDCNDPDPAAPEAAQQSRNECTRGYHHGEAEDAKYAAWRPMGTNTGHGEKLPASDSQPGSKPIHLGWRR